MTHEEFRHMCQSHDLTFEYSDDGAVWRQGCSSLSAIREAAKQLDPADAKRIWDEVVDTKLMPNYRAQFYWKG